LDWPDPRGSGEGGRGRDGGRPLLVAMMVGWFSYTSSSSSPSPAPLTKKLSEPECWPLVVKRFPSEPNSSHEGEVVNALAREGGSENNRSRDSKWFAGDEEPGSLLASLTAAQGHDASAASAVSAALETAPTARGAAARDLGLGPAAGPDRCQRV